MNNINFFQNLKSEIEKRLGTEFYTYKIDYSERGDKLSIMVNGTVYATILRKTKLHRDINYVDDINEYPCYQFEIEEDGIIILHDTKNSIDKGIQKIDNVLKKYFEFPISYDSDREIIRSKFKSEFDIEIPANMIGYDLRIESYFLKDWNDKTNGIESNLILQDLENIKEIRLDCQCYPGIINKGKYVTLVKYTSLPTLMDMMKFGTMRIFSVVGMNDKSELGFVDDYLYEGKKVFADDSDLYQRYHVASQKFVTSLSTQIDNLDMWRWYGRDTMGVCLVFQCLLTDIVNNLHPVSYATKDSLLRKMGEVLRDLKDKGISYEFLSMRNWSSFFKNECYKNEYEFRILFEKCSPSGWLIEESKKIVTPYIDLPLRKSLDSPIEEGMFPLALTHVILGPNIPSKTDNMYQIQLASNYYGKLDFQVHFSREVTYR